MKEMNFTRVAHEFTPLQESTFTIQVRAWIVEGVPGLSERTVTWNVYALIFEEHPRFGDVEWAKNLPFHGGCTYDKFITTEFCTPEEERAKWMRTSKAMKVGSDYAHYMDDHFQSSEPTDGVPLQIQRDCLDLANAIYAAQVQALEAPAEVAQIGND